MKESRKRGEMEDKEREKGEGGRGEIGGEREERGRGERREEKLGWEIRERDYLCYFDKVSKVRFEVFSFQCVVDAL